MAYNRLRGFESVDIQKQIDYWLSGSAEEWELAGHLIDKGKVRQGLFFAHLAVEKCLKGLVCKRSQDVAPKIHNLLRLAELAGLSPSREQRGILGELNTLCITCRYPDSDSPLGYDKEGAIGFLKEAEGILTWLKQRY